MLVACGLMVIVLVVFGLGKVEADMYVLFLLLFDVHFLLFFMFGLSLV